MSGPRLTDSFHEVSSHTQQNLSLAGTPTTKAKPAQLFTSVSDIVPLLVIYSN